MYVYAWPMCLLKFDGAHVLTMNTIFGRYKWEAMTTLCQ